MKRKFVSLVLVMLMVLSSLGAVPALAASISTTVKTTRTGDTLSLRKGPHKGNTPIIGYVKNGTAITLKTTDNDDDPEAWNKVVVKKTGAVGYLKNKYIKYFGLSNKDGEIDRREDNDYDYSDADDNDGKKGNKTGSGTTTGTSTGTSTSLMYAQVKCRVNANVNVRMGAGTNYKVVGTSRNEDELDVKSKSGSWYKVSFRNKSLSGWIHADYVQEGIPGEVTGRSVNMRKGAGTSYGVIRALSEGAEVRVLSKSGSWYRLKYGSTYGWMSSSYVYMY